MNLGTETIFLSEGGTAVIGEGIPIYPGNFWNDEISADVDVTLIASSSTAATQIEAR